MGVKLDEAIGALRGVVSIRCISRMGVKQPNASMGLPAERLNPLHVADGCQTFRCMSRMGVKPDEEFDAAWEVRLNPLHVANGCPPPA